jgi:hypothetical protein
LSGKVGDKITLTGATSNGNGAITYSSTANATVSGTTLTLVTAGSVTVTATAAKTATYDEGKKELTFTIEAAAPTAVDATLAASLQVYPNPTSGIVYIDNAEGAETEVYTISGALVLHSNAATIDLTQYAAGVYIIKVGGKVAKVVKR